MLFQHPCVSESAERAFSSLAPQRRYPFWMSDYRGHASRQSFDITRGTNDPGALDNFNRATDR
jgi:hypothetical protein